MAAVNLFIATSLDGYIARPDGRLDWLENLPNPQQTDYGYTTFFAGIDVVVMGRKTYAEILGFGVPWPYERCRTFVLSRQAGLKVQTPNTEVLTDLSPANRQRIAAASEQGIWLVGGGEVVKAFMTQATIETLYICLIPVILGQGIPLFPKGSPETYLQLERADAYDSGAVMLSYRRADAPW